jgi:hypothetical protein
MKTKKAYYVGTSLYSFRRDEAAEIIGVLTCYPDKYEPTICYHVRYADGFEDYCPISDTNAYKLLQDMEVYNINER